MDGRRVVGVGNIYASEALFRAGINPRRAARRLTVKESTKLTKAIKDTLQAAIRAGVAAPRFRRHRRRIGVRAAPSLRLRPRREEMPALPHADPQADAGTALDLLL